MNYAAEIDSNVRLDKQKSSRSVDISRLKRLAWLLDSAIRIPGTSFRIGLDGLIGLIPGIGDLVAGAASSYILLHAVRLGAPMAITLRMAMNILFEAVIGVIPVVGDIFDFAFKANLRNVQLLLDFDVAPATVRNRSLLIVALTITLVLTLLALAFWALFALLSTTLSAL